MTRSEVVYGCDGCGLEFRVVSERRPRVICPECKIVATPRGDQEALSAYHVGYIRYQEGRRQLGAGLKRYAGDRLVDARAMFNGASDDFEVAVQKFRTATNKADTQHIQAKADTAREKATCFWQGADWLSGATYAQEDDAAQRAGHFREEAESQLLSAREFGTVESPEALGQHTDAEVPEKQIDGASDEHDSQQTLSSDAAPDSPQSGDIATTQNDHTSGAEEEESATSSRSPTAADREAFGVTLEPESDDDD